MGESTWIHRTTLLIWISVHTLTGNVYGAATRNLGNFTDVGVVTGTSINSSPEEENRIVRGVDADLMEEVPYIVGLRQTRDGRNYCGGVLLSKKLVLTAQHCTYNDREDDFGKMHPGEAIETIYVSIGSAALEGEDNGEQIKVIQLHRHPHNNRFEKLYNVVVLELERDVSDTYQHFADIRVQGKFPDESLLPISKTATVYGWGELDQHWDLNDNARSVLRLPIRLQKAKLKLMDKKACQKYHRYTIQAWMICAGRGAEHNFHRPTAEPCLRDSGSPLVRNKQVIGIMSSGRKGSCGYSPAVFTRMTTVQRWVESVVESV